MPVPFPPPYCTAKESEAWGSKSLQGRVETDSKRQKVFFPGQINFKLSSWLFCSITAFFFCPEWKDPHTLTITELQV